jgi:hypothetical protein
MKQSQALPPLVIVAALIAFRASAADIGDDKPLIDDRLPTTLRPAPAPVDVGQDLPVDLPNKPPAPTGERGQEIAKLIHQLGADDFRTRDAAAGRLREIGNDALGPLAEARNDPDPEIASRAAGIIRRITHRTSLFGHLAQGQKGANGQRVHMSVGPNGVQTEVIMGDQRIEITETPAQIIVSATGIEDGRPVSERVAVASVAELKARSPDAAAIYERWGANGRGGGIVGLNGGVPIRIGPAGVPGPFIVRGAPNVQLEMRLPPLVAADDLTTLRRDTLKRMADGNIPADRRAEVVRRFDELSALQIAGEIGDDDAARLRRMRAYNDKCDDLRKLMAELKLPDPGPALPPPAAARLGITIEAEGPDGVTVGKVMEGSRGARIGLKPGDRISLANGKPVQTAVDLRKLVNGPEKLKLTVVRDGANKVLEEKPAPKAAETK